MTKEWILLPPPPDDFTSSHPELPPLIARLLWNRNLRTQTQIDEFLNPDYSQDLHDPFLFKDMSKATDIIFQAIAADKKIVVHGDYDADGVCAAALLTGCLKKLGAREVMVFIPHREIDGYGLNLKTVESFKEQKIDLIITCDCGISNAEEAALAKKYGLQLIITDHHSIPEIMPAADAIIHPKNPQDNYPDQGLCGAAVAFKLVQGLLKKHAQTNALLPDGQTHEAYEKWLLDLVAIATIGDMVPLLGESRTLTRYGLTVLNKTKNLGLQKLLIAAGLTDESGRPKRGSYDTFAVGFQIVPRLNAAGRMDHANFAYALLTTTDPGEAQVLAEQLNKNNSDRQKLTDQIIREAKEYIKNQGTDKTILIAYGEKWPTGVLGLVAGKLKDEYYKPVLVMGKAEEGYLVGSGRSIDEFNMIAAIQKIPDLFLKFGGHPLACGFSLKPDTTLPKLEAKLTELAADSLTGVELKPKIHIDAEVDLDEVNWKMFDLLQKFEPFGQNNEEPVYGARGVSIVAVEPVGADGKHLRLMVKHNSHYVRKTIGFGLGDLNRCEIDWKNCLQPGDKVNLAFAVSVNEWNGNRELQLTIEDIQKI